MRVTLGDYWNIRTSGKRRVREEHPEAEMGGKSKNGLIILQGSLYVLVRVHDALL